MEGWSGGGDGDGSVIVWWSGGGDVVLVVSIVEYSVHCGLVGCCWC